MKCGIYQILNTINNKRYIGSSKNLTHRLWEHKNKLSLGKHSNPHLQSAWNVYGDKAFKFSIIKICDEENLLGFEDYFIKTYISNNKLYGYNIRKVAKSNSGSITARNRYKAGQQVGNFNLIKPVEQREHNWWWSATCICGNEKLINPCRAEKFIPRSCGCIKKDFLRVNRLNYKGQKFNRLTLIEEVEVRGKNQKPIWKTVCDCGNIQNQLLDGILRGKTKSCGCLKREQMSVVGKLGKKKAVGEPYNI